MFNDGPLIGVGFAAGASAGMLLTEAREVKETPLITAAYFAGFVLIYLTELST